MKLFEPYVIGTKLTLVNRIMVPAIVTRLATVEGNVTDALIERYLLYARGGAGIVVTEAGFTTPMVTAGRIPTAQVAEAVCSELKSKNIASPLTTLTTKCLDF